MKRVFAVSYFFISVLTCAFGQENHILDSLKQNLALQEESVDQHRLLMQLATVMSQYSLDSVNSYAHRAREVAIKANLPVQQAQSNGLIGYVHLYGGALDSAGVWYEKARVLFAEERDTLGLVQAMMNLGSVDYYKGNYPQGIERLLEALRLTEDDSSQLSNRAAILNNLGTYYDAWEEDSAALVYYRKALPLKREIGQSWSIASTLTNIGRIYTVQAAYDSAEVYLEEALDLRTRLKDEAGLASTYNALTELYIRQEKYDEAEVYQREAWKRDQQIGDKANLVADLQDWAVIRKGQGQVAEAETYALRALDLANELGIAHDRVNSLKILAEIAEAQQDWRQAVGYWNAHRALSDSLFDREYKEEIARLTQLYESEKKDKDILRLTQETEIQELTLNRRSQQILFLALFSGLLLALAVLVYKQYRQKRLNEQVLGEKNAQLRELNQTKDSLFSIVAHDLRNPLSAFRSLSNSLEEQVFDLSREEIHQFLKRMQASSHQLFDLLQNLLQWAMSQTGRLTFEPRILRLSSVINTVLQPLETEIQVRHLQVATHFDPTLILWADRSMLEIILRNLVSNAIKFSPQEGEIQFLAGEDETGTWVEVHDQGIGLTAEEASQLFEEGVDMRTIGTHSAKGTGLGLQLSKDLIARHGGEISAKPGEENGAIFRLYFPHEQT